MKKWRLRSVAPPIFYSSISSDRRIAMASDDATPNSGSSAHSPRGDGTSSTTQPKEADLTIISNSPPAEVGAATATLDPRQLGQALEGQQLDHVLLEKFVGGGGMGAV